MASTTKPGEVITGLCLWGGRTAETGLPLVRLKGLGGGLGSWVVGRSLPALAPGAMDVQEMVSLARGHLKRCIGMGAARKGQAETR